MRAEFERMGVNYDEVFGRIKDVIIKTIISVEAQVVTCMRQTKHKNACFEIYGFDVIID